LVLARRGLPRTVLAAAPAAPWAHAAGVLQADDFAKPAWLAM